jgi:hypothetical protein
LPTLRREVIDRRFSGATRCLPQQSPGLRLFICQNPVRRTHPLSPRIITLSRVRLRVAIFDFLQLPVGVGRSDSIQVSLFNSKKKTNRNLAAALDVTQVPGPRARSSRASLPYASQFRPLKLPALLARSSIPSYSSLQLNLHPITFTVFIHELKHVGSQFRLLPTAVAPVQSTCNTLFWAPASPSPGTAQKSFLRPSGHSWGRLSPHRWSPPPIARPRVPPPLLPALLDAGCGPPGLRGGDGRALAAWAPPARLRGPVAW